LVDLFMRDIARLLKRPDGRTPELDPGTRQALRSFAEQVKIRLSTEDSAAIRVDLGQGRVYERALTRAELETMIAPWIDRTIAACQRALKDAQRKLGPEGVRAVVMVG